MTICNVVSLSAVLCQYVLHIRPRLEHSWQKLVVVFSQFLQVSDIAANLTLNTPQPPTSKSIPLNIHNSIPLYPIVYSKWTDRYTAYECDVYGECKLWSRNKLLQLWVTVTRHGMNWDSSISIIYIETRGDTSGPTGLSDALVQVKRYEACVIVSRERRILY